MKLKKELQKILSNFQKIMSFMILNRKIIMIPHYLPCFIDNRGRQYFGSLLSPTFYKIFRYLYSFVERKNKIIDLDKSTFYNKIIKYKELVCKFNLNDVNSYLAIVLLMEIGKYYIKAEDDCFIKTEDIISTGIMKMNNNNDLEFEENLYVNNIRNELFKILKGEEVDLNTIIFKDATASGLQNYGILLGYKKDKLKYLNIDGED
jgi:hypothetical protein